MPGSILIACDLKDHLRSVVEAGLAFADGLGARPVLLHVDPHPPLFIESFHAVDPEELARMQRDYRTYALDLLRQTVRGTGRDARDVEVMVREGQPDVEIYEAAKAIGVEAIVVGAERHGVLEHLLIGRTARRVIREAPCAVLTVGVAAPWQGIARVVYATDLFRDSFSDADAWAARLAGTLGAALTLVHVSGVGSHFAEPYTLPVKQLELLKEKLSERFEASRRRVASAARGLLPGPSAIEARLVFADYPANAIVRVAKETHANVIVLGTHGRRGLSRAFLGSVAEGVLRRTDTHVLTVHETDG